MTEQNYVLGVDIGGTFTDFVLVNAKSGQVFLNKRLTTPAEPEQSVTEGVDELLQKAGINGTDLQVVIHGTTLITNALIERKGVRTAFIASEGHKDVLEIGNEMRYDTYDLFLEKPEPLVEQTLRFDAPERISPDGSVFTPLDEAAVVAIARSIAEREVQAVGVCFLHSFINPAHELRVREILRRELPGVAISLSCEVAPEIREYQRMSTTVANAYVQPIASTYLGKLHANLGKIGYNRPIYMMLSSGGVITHESAAEFPIRLVESGPAAGALATATLGARIGLKDLISFDIGGTTAKVCLIDDGMPTTSREFEVARIKRFAKGSGLPLQVPVIEMIEIGAGGGSIARVDEMGLLKVGPDSAGSVPGPACYGRGGDLPTVTDANLILGFLDADSFLGGKMKLDMAKARAAMEPVAKRLHIDVTRAAQGVLDIVNTNMVAAAKMHIAERGGDPRRYAMVAFGGMGPMHAHAVARGLKVEKLICPASAGVLSAWGMLVAPTAFDFARSLLGVLDQDVLDRAANVFRQLEDEGRRLLMEAGVAADAIEFKYSVDMRYTSQIREIAVKLPSNPGELTCETVRRTFMDEYETLFGHVHDDVPIHMITCRLTASTKSRPLPNQTSVIKGAKALKGRRMIHFDAADGPVKADVYDRYRLQPGVHLEGPAVIEENESTVVVPPGATVDVDATLNVIVSLNGRT